MNEKFINIISIIIGILVTVIIIILGYIFIFKPQFDKCCMCGDIHNDCCPCPNYKYVDEVEQYIGYKSSGAGSWLEMCEKYKQDKNKTFGCFE